VTATGLRVGLAFDLRASYRLAPGMPRDRYAELDDERTIAAIEAALVGAGHTVDRIGGLLDLAARIAGRGPGVDVVFNVAEGVRGRGREAQVPALLEACGVPYTGSDPVALAVSLDKALTKRLWRAEGLPTPAFQVVATAAELDRVPASFPSFVKPLAEGSSIGVDHGAVVRDMAALRARVASVWTRYGQPALIEPYLPGREFTVGILDAGGVPTVLGVAETAPAGGLRGYDEKRATASRVGDPPFRAVVEPALERELATLALRAAASVGCRDLARVDLRCDDAGRPQLLEINALPGLAPEVSAMAFLARHAGRAYRDMIVTVLDGAVRRRNARPQR
jgi:D-alanine-D-alanine ligase